MTSRTDTAAFWNERYSRETYVYGDQPNDFLRTVAGTLPSGGRVLSLAEGEGRNAVYLATLGYDVCGIDQSRQGQEKAFALAASKGVSIDYLIADIVEFDMDEAIWDGVVGIFCHLPKAVRAGLYERIRMALKPGGAVVFEVYNPQQLGRGTGGPKEEHLLIPVAELKEAFADFDILLAQEALREVHEGSFHSGLGSVTQFVACKPESL